MDSLAYHYDDTGSAPTNQLDHVTDAVTGAPYTEDFPSGQAANTNTYDGDGNLVSDASEGGMQIQWDAGGRVKRITRTRGAGAGLRQIVISYVYDAMGNRVKQVVGDFAVGPKLLSLSTTYWVYDANGIVVAIYEEKCDSIYVPKTKGRERIVAGDSAMDHCQWLRVEHPIYGLGREGIARLANPDLDSIPSGNIYTRKLDERRYELRDHLGNARAVLSDRKLSDLNGSGIPEKFRADIRSHANLYPFGQEQPGRYTNSAEYRYGYNGMERDTSGTDGHYTTYFRQYDARLGRWWGIDPVENPSESPYAAMSNNPIALVDPSGAAGDSTKSGEPPIPENPKDGLEATGSDGTPYIWISMRSNGRGSGWLPVTLVRGERYLGDLVGVPSWFDFGSGRGQLEGDIRSEFDRGSSALGSKADLYRRAMTAMNDPANQPTISQGAEIPTRPGIMSIPVLNIPFVMYDDLHVFVTHRLELCGVNERRRHFWGEPATSDEVQDATFGTLSNTSLFLNPAGAAVKSGSALTRADAAALRSEVAATKAEANVGVSGAALAAKTDDVVTYYRVQGGVGSTASKRLVKIDVDGNVSFVEHTLNVSVGTLEHARYFQQLRPGSQIFSFKVPKWFDDLVQEAKIPQQNYRSNPLNQRGLAPKINDPTTPGLSLELPVIWSKWLNENVIPGSGVIIP